MSYQPPPDRESGTVAGQPPGWYLDPAIESQTVRQLYGGQRGRQAQFQPGITGEPQPPYSDATTTGATGYEASGQPAAGRFGPQSGPQDGMAYTPALAPNVGPPPGSFPQAVAQAPPNRYSNLGWRSPSRPPSQVAGVPLAPRTPHRRRERHRLRTALLAVGSLVIVIVVFGVGVAVGKHSTEGSSGALASSSHSAATASTTSPTPSLVSAMATNERLFAEAMAASIPVAPANVVARATMRDYVQFEHAYGAAGAAVGQPFPGESVTQVPGGFKLCVTSSSSCDTYTDFTTNHAGQITGVLVNGQPVAGRIATAPTATSDGLTISGVVAYQLTNAQNAVAVAFKLTDTSYRPINTSPALLASLSGASVDPGNDGLPATLAPGDSVYAAAVFDVTQDTGLFCLQPNDGFGEHLPCTTLSKV